MDSVTYEIDALDTLFFRDGRPFAMGDNSWATHIFPPYPSTIYGMLRSLYFEQQMETLSDANGPNDPTASLSILAYGLYLREEGEETKLLLPMPRDYVITKSDHHYRALTLQKNDDISSNRATDQLSYTGTSDITVLREGSYVTSSQLNGYLQGNPVTEVINLSDYTAIESKVGIGRNAPTGRAEDGLLYRIETRRLQRSLKGKRISICTTIQGLDRLGVANLHRCGGKERLVVSRMIDGTVEQIDRPSRWKEGSIRVYLATPGIFKEGWAPISLFSKYHLNIIASAVGSPVHIGGWDIQQGLPKAMLKGVPAGSVYYLSGRADDLSRFANDYHGCTLYSSDIEDSFHYSYAKQGFGLAYIGKS